MFKKYNRRKHNRGSTLVEFILVLFIALIFISITAQAIKDIDKHIKYKEEISDEISLLQLKRILLLSYEIEINNNSLEYIYQNRKFYISEVNNNLIIQPGTQIILLNVNNVSFIEDDNDIYLLYEKKDKKYERLLGKK